MPLYNSAGGVDGHHCVGRVAQELVLISVVVAGGAPKLPRTDFWPPGVRWAQLPKTASSGDRSCLWFT